MIFQIQIANKIFNFSLIEILLKENSKTQKIFAFIDENLSINQLSVNFFGGRENKIFLFSQTFIDIEFRMK
jgi:hypothetical protein